MVLATAFVMLTVVRVMSESCDATDASLVFLSEALCWSLGGGCGCTGNVTAIAPAARRYCLDAILLCASDNDADNTRPAWPIWV